MKYLLFTILIGIFSFENVFGHSKCSVGHQVANLWDPFYETHVKNYEFNEPKNTEILRIKAFLQGNYIVVHYQGNQQDIYFSNIFVYYNFQ